MRYSAPLSCLAWLPILTVRAQSQEPTFSFQFPDPTPTRSLVTITDAATAVPAPTGTGEPCGLVAEAISSSRRRRVYVDAELAYNCLTSVPFDRQNGLDTLEAITRMTQWQSTLALLKNPPSEGYDNPPVDILGEFTGVRQRILDGQYQNEYSFEEDIANDIGRAYDGHFTWDGMAYTGVFRWTRDFDATLVSVSLDGAEPRIYALSDINSTTTTPSPVTSINGQDAIAFLQNEALQSAYHDPDTRWNSLFFLGPAESYGQFIRPRAYPGPTLELTFENGTTAAFTNRALVMDSSSWVGISDGSDFYRAFVQYSPSQSSQKREIQTMPNRTPSRLQLRNLDETVGRRQAPQENHNPGQNKESGWNTKFRQRDEPVLEQRDFDEPHAPLVQKVKTQTIPDEHQAGAPLDYPDAFVVHSAEDVYLAGYFIETPIGRVAVLMIQTFNTESDNDSQEFQSLLENFISEAKTQGAQKVLIDVRANGGGKIFLGYETFKQFFPNIEPFGGNRYRAHSAVDLIGEQVSTLRLTRNTADLYTSPFNYHSYLDADLADFASWDDMYGPVTSAADTFTNTLRYNLSDPLLTTSEDFGIGITLTGYLDRASVPSTPPFRAEDIMILSDGICASTCALFTEMMTREAGVRTFAIGGRPQPGPMQPVGGTKGSNVLFAEYLLLISDAMLRYFASSRTEAQRWADVLPFPFAINAADASVNFKDQIREGQETPLQFTNETADCRIWYAPNMVTNVTAVWEAVAEASWGGEGGGIDAARCVPGSSRREQDAAAPSGGSGGDSEGAAAGAFGRPVGGVMQVVMCVLVLVAQHML
ncbi:hypothetical protein H2201_005200 [Coniosporium apollinis]|uniref:CPAF-like PDZ domain-containing protein n=1 Tax=Coniosporium apollinis TaxID=61459 RepID=A0ABQ9NQI2_9PEZI|nr:hypothetical protein H2201_005200 [Coniosporium apollinis]